MFIRPGLSGGGGIGRSAALAVFVAAVAAMSRWARHRRPSGGVSSGAFIPCLMRPFMGRCFPVGPSASGHTVTLRPSLPPPGVRSFGSVPVGIRDTPMLGRASVPITSACCRLRAIMRKRLSPQMRPVGGRLRYCLAPWSRSPGLNRSPVSVCFAWPKAGGGHASTVASVPVLVPMFGFLPMVRPWARLAFPCPWCDKRAASFPLPWILGGGGGGRLAAGFPGCPGAWLPWCLAVWFPRGWSPGCAVSWFPLGLSPGWCGVMSCLQILRLRMDCGRFCGRLSGGAMSPILWTRSSIMPKVDWLRGPGSRCPSKIGLFSGLHVRPSTSGTGPCTGMSWGVPVNEEGVVKWHGCYGVPWAGSPWAWSDVATAKRW